MKLFDGILVPTVLYGYETWSWAYIRSWKNRAEVQEMKGLRDISEVKSIDKIKNV